MKKMKRLFWVTFSCVFTVFLPNIPAAQAQSTCVNYSNVQSAIGLYFPGRGAFYLNDPDNSQFIQVVNFGPQNTNLIGLTGDWNNSGFDGIGYYDPATGIFNLKYQATPGPADLSFQFGGAQPGIIKPVAGDWTGKGYKSIGFYDSDDSTFRLKNTNTGGFSDIILSVMNIPGGIPIVGDWVGDGVTRVGIYDPATSIFHLRMTNDPANNTMTSFQYGAPHNGLSPVIGKWMPSMTTDGVGLQNGNGVLERYALAAGAIDATVYSAPQGNPNTLPPQMIIGKWKPSQCLAAGQNTSPASPSWMNGMIIYQLSIDTFTGVTVPGTFKSATAQLPYLNSLGVTGIIIDPVASLNSTYPDPRMQIFFNPSLPDVLDPRLGTDADFANLVSQAHALGIKVFVYNVLHGISPYSPYLPAPVDGITYNPPFTASSSALPSDFFSYTAAGTIVKTGWGSAQWDWTSPGLRNWWINNISIAWVQKYNVDGFCLDLEPTIAGTTLWNQIRSSVLASTGKQIALIPEQSTPGHGYTFDLPLNGVEPGGTQGDFYNGPLNFVDYVKSLPENYYSYLISNYANPPPTIYTANGRLSI